MRPDLAHAQPSAEETAELQALIKAHCGLRIDASKLEHALFRAWPRLASVGITDVAGLIRGLAARLSRPWAVFLPFVTINETYFQREARQLDDFRELALPELRKRAGSRPLRLLSAACSSGEEPYTLAIMLADARVPGSVLGVDIDPEALALAEAASYGANSFRGVDEAWCERHFESLSNGRLRVAKPYRDLVSFKRANLLALSQDLGTERFDAVFCRNVLIYFDRPTQLRVLAQLRQHLQPGGYLFLGHSEMFFDVDLGLAVRSTARATMYQRTEEA